MEADRLRRAGSPSGAPPGELLRALAVLAEPPEPAHARVAEALGLEAPPDGTAYASTFLFGLRPYASVYVGPEGMIGGEARDRIAGFWRAVGRRPPAEPDHLSALLGLYAALLEDVGGAEPAESALLGRGARALLEEHLASWVFVYLDRMRLEPEGFFSRWATLTAEALSAAVEAGGPPASLPVHLREAPALPDPRSAGGGGFVQALLTPVRTGMLLTRGDLVGLAGALGLGARVGERRRVLEHLLAMEAAGALDGLAGFARRAADLHEARAPLLGPVAAYWAGRARDAAALLSSLAQDGATVVESVEPGS